MVEATGFEPTTSWSRTKRATNCATPRYLRPARAGLSHYIKCILELFGAGDGRAYFQSAAFALKRLADFAGNSAPCCFLYAKSPLRVRLSSPAYLLGAGDGRAYFQSAAFALKRLADFAGNSAPCCFLYAKSPLRVRLSSPAYLLGAGDGSRTRRNQLGKLTPYR